MAYREAPPPPEPTTLDIRPSPRWMAGVVAIAAAFLLVPGLAFLDESSKGGPLSSALFGVPLALGGIGFFVVAYRMFTTIVRFLAGDQSITIQWRRGRSVLRSEVVPRDDLVDIAVEKSEKSAMRLVVGTRRGDIPLSGSFTLGENHYRRTIEQIRMFLKVRVRPPNRP